MKTRIVAAMAMLWCGCVGDDGPPRVTIIDAAIDAAPDAPPDAPPVPMEIVDACTHACARIGECAGVTPAPTCVPKCELDLADCTPQQVMDVDACSHSECGQDSQTLGMCLLAVSCVGG